jgi:hypothetical protein
MSEQIKSLTVQSNDNFIAEIISPGGNIKKYSCPNNGRYAMVAFTLISAWTRGIDPRDFLSRDQTLIESIGQICKIQ